MNELWRRWRAVTILQLLAAAAAAFTLALVMDGIRGVLANPRPKLLVYLLFALYAIPFRYAVASVEPSDGRPVAFARYALACVAAAAFCAMLSGVFIRPSLNIWTHRLPVSVDVWHGFFPPLVHGLALVLVYASVRNHACARRGLQEAELARAEQSQRGARERLDVLTAHLDVEGLRRALHDIDLEYEHDAATAARRIDALIESLRLQLREAAAHDRGASPDPAVPSERLATR